MVSGQFVFLISSRLYIIQNAGIENNSQKFFIYKRNFVRSYSKLLMY